MSEQYGMIEWQMVMSSMCVVPRPRKHGERVQFESLVQTPVERRTSAASEWEASCLYQIAKVRRRRGRHCLKRHGCRLVDDPLSDRQPVECSEQRSGVCSAFTLANDPGQVVLRSAQDVESCRRHTEQQSVAVIQSGGNDTACQILSAPSCRSADCARDAGRVCGSYTLLQRPWRGSRSGDVSRWSRRGISASTKLATGCRRFRQCGCWQSTATTIKRVIYHSH